MWKVLFLLTVLTVSCEPYSKKHKTPPNRNQRIIKVQGPPHFNHFHGHQKPVRKRPFKVHHGEEFIRPNHPPPIPPFFDGPSTNHIKHLPRPPPHVFHKSPSYGLGFPYKVLNSNRPVVSKDKFRKHTLSSLAVRPASVSSSSSASVSTSTTFHSLPTFSSSSSFVSSPVSHIISSDDNNGPIREIPAPNLGPKAHESSYSSISVSDISGIGGFSGIGNVGVSGIGSIGGIEGVTGQGGVKIKGLSDVSVVGGVLHEGGGISSGGIHGVRGVGGVGNNYGGSGGGIHYGLGEGGGLGGIGNVASVGGVTHVEPEALLHSVAENPNAINLDSIVKDQGLEVNPYIKESSGDVHHGKGPTVEIANFDEGSSIDVTNLIKDASGTSDHHSGYEVTEHQNHLPTNDQIIKGHDGTKLYYAPDPDPSLPVHKVPPTNDPHSTPSNGQNTNNVYIPQISHGFPYLPGGPVGPVGAVGAVGAPLSSQELYHLMHGYPAVISQPVIAFVSQPHAPGAILQGVGPNYIQQGSGSYDGGHYSQEENGANDISQYLQQPEIHNLLHNSPESYHEQEQIGGSHSSVVSQSLYAPQNQYQSYQSQYQTSIKDSNVETSETENFPTSEINHNYQYEPEASETANRNSLTVIRQTGEGTLNSVTDKEQPNEDSIASDINYRSKETSENIPTILQLKNIPEVPFYASLPSQKAAEALASLQAAGSVANNYMNKIKLTRGDQGDEEQTRDRTGKSGNGFEGETIQVGSEKTLVEIQKSLPIYETRISSKNLLEDEDDKRISEDYSEDIERQGESELSNLNLQEDDGNETFGKRIRPK